MSTLFSFNKSIMGCSPCGMIYAFGIETSRFGLK